jgi:hypothetical protein
MVKLSRAASSGALSENITTIPTIAMQKKSSVGVAHARHGKLSLQARKEGSDLCKIRHAVV